MHGCYQTDTTDYTPRMTSKKHEVSFGQGSPDDEDHAERCLTCQFGADLVGVVDGSKIDDRRARQALSTKSVEG